MNLDNDVRNMEELDRKLGFVSGISMSGKIDWFLDFNGNKTYLNRKAFKYYTNFGDELNLGENNSFRIYQD